MKDKSDWNNYVEKFTDILGTWGAGLWEWDRQSDVMVVDQLWRQIHLLSAEYSLANLQDYIKMIHPEDRTEVIAQFQKGKIRKDGTQAEFKREINVTYRILVPGGYRWMWMTGQYFDSTNEKVGKAVGLVKDITVRLEKNLRLERFRQMMDSIKMGILVVDLESTTIADANETVLAWLGHTKEECSKLKLHEALIVINGTECVWWPQVLDTLTREELWCAEGKIKLKDNNFLPVEVMISLNDVDDEKWPVVILRDITEEKKLQQELEEQRIKSLHSAKMASLGEMSSGIAHEINNPLTIILGIIQQMQDMLEKGQLVVQPLVALLGKMASTVHRITKIVEGLRFFARETDDHYRQRILVKKIIDETLGLCLLRFESNGIKVRCAHFDENLMVEVNPIEISQVILNIFNNSYDAISARADKWINIEVSCLSDSNMVSIAISDSGSGIPESLWDKIMLPFFTTKEVGKGTGLGLSISKGIIEKHGGHFIFDHLAKNTLFKVELPKAKD